MKISAGILIVSLFKWAARILSLLSIIAIIISAMNDGLDLSGLDFKELTLILCFPFGVVAGLLIAWWWEGLGGGIALLSLISFYISAYIFSGAFPEGSDYLKLSSPAFIFIFYSIITYNARHREKYF